MRDVGGNAEGQRDRLSCALKTIHRQSQMPRASVKPAVEIVAEALVLRNSRPKLPALDAVAQWLMQPGRSLKRCIGQPIVALSVPRR